MTLPRHVAPGRFYMLTRRTLERRYFLLPGEDLNNNYVYCLTEAAQRCEIELILPQMLSNHHHPVFYDRHGKAIEFMERAHKLIARSVNRLRGRIDRFWSGVSPCLTELGTPEDVMRKLVYAATNPVKHGLVERARDWPGPNFLDALLDDRPMQAVRPKYFFRRDGDLPEQVELRLVIPPELGDPATVRRILRERVALEEEHFRQKRREQGQKVVGRRNILRHSPNAAPNTDAPPSEIRPRVAASDPEVRKGLLARNRLFAHEYAKALAAKKRGTPVPFPYGTYALARRYSEPVAVEDPPSWPVVEPRPIAASSLDDPSLTGPPSG